MNTEQVYLETARQRNLNRADVNFFFYVYDELINFQYQQRGNYRVVKYNNGIITRQMFNRQQ